MWFRIRYRQTVCWHRYDPATGSAICGGIKINVIQGRTADMRPTKPAQSTCCHNCLRHLAAYTPHKPNWLAV